MILKTSTHNITINSFTGNNGLTLYVPLNANLGDIRTAVQTASELSFYNVVEKDGKTEETLTAVLTGKFVFDRATVDAEHIKLVFAKHTDDVARLEEAITNLELAMTELYEGMGV